MPVEKLSVTLDAEIVARARRAAQRDGVSLSTWLDRAARRALDLEERQAVSDFAEHGEPTGF